MKSVAVLLFCCVAGAFGSLVGGKTPLTPNDVESPEFRRVMDFATLKMNSVSNHPRFHAIFSFVEGTKQVVGGLSFEFSVVLRATNCENHEALNEGNLLNCPPLNLLGASEFHCTFKVLWRPWADQLTMPSPPVCMQPREAPAAAFAGQKVPLTPEEVASPMFQGAMTASAVHFNQHSQLANLHSLVRYDRATKQVVAGLLYEFDGVFAETICENTPENHGKGVEECAVGNSARTFACHFRVLFKSWATPQYTVLDQMVCRSRV